MTQDGLGWMSSDGVILYCVNNYEVDNIFKDSTRIPFLQPSTKKKIETHHIMHCKKKANYRGLDLTLVKLLENE